MSPHNSTPNSVDGALSQVANYPAGDYSWYINVANPVTENHPRRYMEVRVYTPVTNVVIAIPPMAATGQSIEATASAQGRDPQFSWTFPGAATPISGSTVTHAFTSAGEYQVAVTAGNALNGLIPAEEAAKPNLHRVPPAEPLSEATATIIIQVRLHH